VISTKERLSTLADGKTLTAKARRKVERLWDQLGPHVAAPAARPFHVYRPRSKAGRERVARLLGLDPKKVRGVRAFPVPVVAGAGRARVRITREGLDVTYRVKRRRGKRRVGRAIRRTREILLEPDDLLAPARSPRLRRADREQAKGHAVRLRTGPGHWSPLEHGHATISGGVAYLTESYEDADDWLEAIEIVEWDL
jgi:hypothetical protein